jgi:cytochrome c biogenesis protein CcdA/thiol-disulfide isomerase/thioredoxin
VALFVLVYLAGVLTIVSPCILPVLPFVFARTGRPFVTSALPMLIGMAVTFAIVATLAAAGGGWAVEANEVGRLAAMVLLAVSGVSLLLPGVSMRLAQPVVVLGARLTRSADELPADGVAAVPRSLVLGVATGLLWAPCAGPILGLILTGAALNGASVQTSALLAAYAAGAATSLGVALLLGGRFLAARRWSVEVGEGLRRIVGACVLASVAAIALGLDTSVLSQVSVASTTTVEEGLLSRFDSSAAQLVATQPVAEPVAAESVAAEPVAAEPVAPEAATAQPRAAAPPTAVPTAAPRALQLPVGGSMPALSGAVQWLNSPPLTREQLQGKVVLVDFWTYSCINCLRELPYVQAWADKYRDQGLVVIGVHAPEFAFEKNVDNVTKATQDLKINFPVAVDNDFAIWRGFNNEYWPAEYFIDAQGQIRHHQFGEGDYDQSERVIQQLLASAGSVDVPGGLASVSAGGVEAAADEDDVGSPETYIGSQLATHFISPGGFVRNARSTYMSGTPRLNEWGLSGDWTVMPESATLDAPNGGIAYRFHARDLHLVLGPAAGSGPIRFRVTIDGAAPGPDHGVDVGDDGSGVVTDERLYQLVRTSGGVADHLFEIEFLDPGVQAYSFTFG